MLTFAMHPFVVTFHDENDQPKRQFVFASNPVDALTLTLARHPVARLPFTVADPPPPPAMAPGASSR